MPNSSPRSRRFIVLIGNVMVFSTTNLAVAVTFCARNLDGSIYARMTLPTNSVAPVLPSQKPTRKTRLKSA